MAEFSRFYPAVRNGNTDNAISDRVSCPAMIAKIFEDLRYALSSKFCSHHRNVPIAVKGKRIILCGVYGKLPVSHLDSFLSACGNMIA